MKLKLIVSFGIFFILILISCRSQPVAPQTPTPTPTIKPTITNSPRPTATATIRSTVTPSPTFSPEQETEAVISTRVGKAMQTQENFMFVAAPATLEARNVKCQDGFILAEGLDVIRVSNDKWTVFTCSPRPQNKDKQWTPGVDNYGNRYTQIIKADLSQTWIIKHSTFDYSIINRPDAMLSPFRWTEDGKYLYLYPRYYPGGSGFRESANLQTNISSLYRINLETGIFELILQSGQFGALELSPDGHFLAYSEQSTPDIIHVRNMDNGNDLAIKLNEKIIAAGAFVWNLESTKVVLTAGYGKLGENRQDDLSATAIFVLSPENMHFQKVLAKDTRIFEPSRCSDDDNFWLDDDTI
jgi:hypothetical protein